VEQTVVAPRCAGIDVPFLGQDARYASHAQVSGQACSGDPAPNDQDLRVHILSPFFVFESTPGEAGFSPLAIPPVRGMVCFIHVTGQGVCQYLFSKSNMKWVNFFSLVNIFQPCYGVVKNEKGAAEAGGS
jgi:hypothetical protein